MNTLIEEYIQYANAGPNTENDHIIYKFHNGYGLSVIETDSYGIEGLVIVFMGEGYELGIEQRYNLDKESLTAFIEEIKGRDNI